MADSLRKKMLIVSLNIPYPLTHGGAIAQYFFLKELSSIHNITFCSHAHDKKQKNSLDQLAASLPLLKVIYSTEENNNAGVASRLRTAYRKLKEKLIRNETISDDLQELWFHRDNFFLPKPFTDFFQLLIQNNEYDTIQLEFFETLSLFPLLPSSTKKIYVCHEIKTKRISRLVCKAENLAHKNYVMASIKAIETSFLKLVDQVVVFTGDDNDYLSALGINSMISPYGIPQHLLKKQGPSDIYNRLLFMGNERMFPNREGLKWFLDEIYLPNEKIISWPLLILGEWSEKFKNKYRHPKIIFEGLVDILQPYYVSSVLISPVLSGSGLRTKILMAFANHIPVMSTAFASEGLNGPVNGQEHLLHFESADEFVTHFKKIENNASILKSVAENAYNFYNENFCDRLLIEKRNSIYQTH